MSRRRIVYECDACHKEYNEADYNDSGDRVEIDLRGQYYDESIGQRTWNENVQLCPECWDKLNKFFKEELKLNLYTWARY